MCSLENLLWVRVPCVDTGKGREWRAQPEGVWEEAEGFLLLDPREVSRDHSSNAHKSRVRH